MRRSLARADDVRDPSKQAQVPRPPEAVADPQPTTPTLDARRFAIFASVSPDCSVLEIGHAHDAILPKRDGFNVRTVDCLDRAGLVQKDRAFKRYSPDAVGDVDFVVDASAAMSDAIDATFDLVLASHVLEHTTRRVHFMNDCTGLLAPGGAIALVAPEGRSCVDRFRERSSLARAIDAAENPPAVNTVGTLVEFSINAVRHGATAWKPHHRGRCSFINSLVQVKDKGRLAGSGKYVGVHGWVFTPNHLRLLLDDLYRLGYASVREAYFRPTVGHEFFLNLSATATATASGSGLSREKLMRRAQAELRTLDQALFARVPGNDKLLKADHGGALV